MALNSSLSEVEKVPQFPTGEAAAPDRPAGRNVLVPRSESADVGDPEASALRAGGTQSCN
eukprot:14625704-Alexandrium_andersonii.AAC.1